MTYSPIGRATSASPTFSWPAVSGATYYKFYLSEYTNTQFITLTPAQVDPGSTGTCTFTPTAAMSGVGNGPFLIPLGAGHTAAWWIEAYNASNVVLNSPGELTFFVPGAATSTTDYAISDIDTFETDPITKLYYVTDFIGQSRRVIDFAVGSGTNGLGTKVFQENLWTTIDISDLVPSSARMAILSMEIISSCSNGDMMGWMTRRTGSTILHMPNGPLRYVVAPKGDLRATVEFTVLLNNGKFDFLWSHVVNGIDYAAANSSTVTGRTLNASLVAYGTP